MDATLNNLLIVGALLFTLGLVGFLTRRNLIVMFLCAELMLQGVSVTLVAFSRHHGTWGGQVFSIFSLAVAASEAAIALALIVVLFRRNESLDVSIWQDLREPDQAALTEEAAGPIDPNEADPVQPRLTRAGVLPAQGAARKDSTRPPVPGGGRV